MYQFYFNGKNSLKDMNCLVKGKINFPVTTEKVEHINIPNRRKGSVTIKTGEYEDLELNITLKMIDFKDFESKKEIIYSWLNDIEDNKLIFNNDSYCYIVKSVTINKFSPNNFQFTEIPVKFVCEPFKKMIHEDKKEIANGEIIYNLGEESEPIIYLTLPDYTQNIQIDINGMVFQIENVKNNVTVNSEDLIIIGEGRIKSIGNFPVLNKGENIIKWTGNIIKFEMDQNTLIRG